MAVTGRPLRVVMVVRLFSPWVGGMERQAHKLAVTMHDQGLADARIATGRWFRDTAGSEDLDGVTVRRTIALWTDVRGLGKPGALLYMAGLFVHLVATRRSYDIIHVHGLSYHTAICSLVSRLTGRPMIVKLANAGEASDIEKMRRGQHFPGTRHLLPLALSGDRYVALNEGIARELEEAGVSSERIVSIPNGVFVPEPPQPKTAWIPPLRLVYVGRLHAQKSVDTVLVALGILRRRSVDVVLDLVGEGPDRDRLRRVVEREEIGDRVLFHGIQPEVGSFLAAADALVLPSSAEGMSNALLESMAAATPGIVSDIPGNRAVVTDGIDGWVFPLGDADALAALLERLVDDPTLVREAGREAYLAASRSFSLEAVACRYVEEYDRLVGLPAEVSG